MNWLGWTISTAVAYIIFACLVGKFLKDIRIRYRNLNFKQKEVCDMLEVPEDYQWAPDREYVATLSAHEGYDQLCTSMSKKIRLPESTLPL